MCFICSTMAFSSVFQCCNMSANAVCYRVHIVCCSALQCATVCCTVLHCAAPQSSQHSADVLSSLTAPQTWRGNSSHRLADCHFAASHFAAGARSTEQTRLCVSLYACVCVWVGGWRSLPRCSRTVSFSLSL